MESVFFYESHMLGCIIVNSKSHVLWEGRSPVHPSPPPPSPWTPGHSPPSPLTLPYCCFKDPWHYDILGSWCRKACFRAVRHTWSLYTFINRISWTTLLLIQRVTCCGKEGMMTFWIVGALRRVFEDFKSGVCYHLCAYV